MRPTPEQVREALPAVRLAVRASCACNSRRRPCEACRALLVLESALAPPPVEDAAVEEALAAARAKISALCHGEERWRMSVHPDPDALNESRRILAQAERNYQQVQLAAAENRGFRAAIERLEDYAVTQDAGGSKVVYFAQDFLRAEADRREGSDE